MSAIVIIGAGGLIGRSLARQLIERGHTVRGFGMGEQFLTDQAAFAPLFASGRFSFVMGSVFDRYGLLRALMGADVVVHLAAMTNSARTAAAPLQCFDINVIGTRNVLDSCVEAGVKHLVFASSSAVYGEPARTPIDETAELKPRNIYGVTKVASEYLVRGFHQQFPAFDFTIARIFNVYGEGGNTVFAVNAFVASVLGGKRPVVNGDGLQTRCFTHADDIAGGLALMVENPAARNQVFNLGNPGAVMTIRGLAEKVIAQLAPDSGLEVELVPLAPEVASGAIIDSRADIARAAEQLGFQPSIGLEEGIRRVATYPPHDELPFVISRP